jgi:hypothetical protein
VDEDEGSLLTPELLAYIGTETAEEIVWIDRTVVRRSEDTVLGEHREHAPGDEVDAFVLLALAPERGRPRPPPVLPGAIVASTEWVLERPLRFGERLSRRYRIADVRERMGGRYGHHVQFTTEGVLRDEHGALVARSIGTIVQFDPARPAPDEQS